MLRHIHIENFKSIKKMGVSLGGLNLLFGMNGMGKSSTIQTLLLSRQSFYRGNCAHIDRLYPNGELVGLGTIDRLVCDNANSNFLRFKYKFDSHEEMILDFPFKTSNINSNYIERAMVKTVEAYDEALFDDRFVYLSAEHIGPQGKYAYENWSIDGINKFGSHGEYTVPFLAMNGDKIEVPYELCVEKGRSHSLIDQVSAWMDSISSGIRLNSELYASDQEAKLKVSYNNDKERLVTGSYSPVNVGFGIPYVLPIIVSILSAKKGSLILIENPESHLHPRAQVSIAQLMAKAASYGIQIICESHSDHIINGVRVAIKEKSIKKEDVAIIYFDKDEHLNTKTTTISVDDRGNLDTYPLGLLDEWGELMARLI